MAEPAPPQKSTEDAFHRLVVLSDPYNNGGHVVLVRAKELGDLVQG